MEALAPCWTGRGRQGFPAGKPEFRRGVKHVLIQLAPKSFEGNHQTSEQ